MENNLERELIKGIKSPDREKGYRLYIPLSLESLSTNKEFKIP